MGRVAVASVWLTFGVVFKAANLVPRHRRIIARILGESWTGIATAAVALGEAGIALWMLAGIAPCACMAVQTAAIVTMNALEIRLARDLLLSPRLMVAANLLFLAFGWWIVLSPRR